MLSSPFSFCRSFIFSPQFLSVLFSFVYVRRLEALPDHISGSFDSCLGIVKIYSNCLLHMNVEMLISAAV